MSSSYTTRYEKLHRVHQGKILRAVVWVYKNNNGITPSVQLVEESNDPLRDPEAQPLFSQTITTDGQWVAVPIEWRNEYGYDVEVIIRVMATAASGNFWCLVDITEPKIIATV